MNKIRLIYMEDDKEIGQLDLHEDHELTNLKVLPKRRREGIAHMLVQLGEAVALEMGYPRVYATVALDNKASNGLWAKRSYSKYFKYEKILDA